MGNSFEIHIAADNIEQAKQEIMTRARKALTAIGIQVSSLARTEIQKSPSRIDTGLLRNSITYALDGEGTAISSYSADKASRYSGKTPPSGSYGGTTPKEPQGRQAVYIGTGKWREAERHELMELPVTHWMPLPEPPKEESDD